MGGGLLDKGHLTLRQREIVIDRVTARCGSEYEWGVHVAFFAKRAGLDAAQQRSLVRGGPDDACWSAEDALLIRLCDALHERCDVDDGLWAELRARFSEEAILELLLLAGFYRTVSRTSPTRCGCRSSPTRRGSRIEMPFRHQTLGPSGSDTLNPWPPSAACPSAASAGT